MSEALYAITNRLRRDVNRLIERTEVLEARVKKDNPLVNPIDVDEQQTLIDSMTLADAKAVLEENDRMREICTRRMTELSGLRKKYAGLHTRYDDLVHDYATLKQQRDDLLNEVRRLMDAEEAREAARRMALRGCA
jgi:hypothetical protein